MNQVTPQIARTLETKTCGRCGGTGKHSYCQMYGSTCFGCGGAGKVYTKRGLAAKAFLENLRSATYAELQVGQCILTNGITFGGQSYSEWATVEGMEMQTEPTAWSVVDGEMVGHLYLAVSLSAVKNPSRKTLAHVIPDSRVRVAQTAEQKANTLRQALDYQDTLTKTGTPRKTRGSK